jgi:hypothetical protein
MYNACMNIMKHNGSFQCVMFNNNKTLKNHDRELDSKILSINSNLLNQTYPNIIMLTMLILIF